MHDGGDLSSLEFKNCHRHRLAPGTDGVFVHQEIVSHAIGIVAHVARTEQAHQLMRNVGACYASLDNGTFGCHGNHRRVWRHLVEHASADHCVVLEDDAVPCDNFRCQLEQALTVSPAPVVSLYLGKVRPPQYQWMIEPAIKRADNHNASFIRSPHLLHAVGLAIRADLVRDMLNTIDEQLPIDEAIGEWIQKRCYRIAYTWPSLVDHADGETLLKHRDGEPRQAGRVAWRFGTRTNWENRLVEMN